MLSNLTLLREVKAFNIIEHIDKMILQNDHRIKRLLTTIKSSLLNEKIIPLID